MIRSRLAERIAERGMGDRVRASAGAPRGNAAWVASRSAQMTIVNWGELPDDATDGNLQNADGEFVFLVGYSALGGTDVLA